MSVRLLRAGIARYREADLAPRADERTGFRTGFRGGARWMARAMGRAIDDDAARRAGWLAWWKYGLSIAAAVAAAALAAQVHVVLALAAFVIAFYAVEVQGLFLLPLVVMGARAPWSRSRALVAAGGGTARAVLRVLPIAAWMIFAGVQRGFARAWCEGCLAVIVWFEEAVS